MKVSVLLVSEPNKNGIRGRQDWIDDQELDSATRVLDEGLAIRARTWPEIHLCCNSRPHSVQLLLLGKQRNPGVRGFATTNWRTSPKEQEKRNDYRRL